jgi:hypothetical protein
MRNERRVGDRHGEARGEHANEVHTPDANRKRTRGACQQESSCLPVRPTDLQGYARSDITALDSDDEGKKN